MGVSGYFEIGIYHPKTSENVGTLWRSAYQLGAAGIFTIGRRYKKQHSDTYHAPGNIPYRHFENWESFISTRPYGALLIGIEMGGIALGEFTHPKQAVYLLGSEDHGLPPDIMAACNNVVSLEAVRRSSYNVAMAGTIVMYDRMAKFGGLNGSSK